MTDLATWQDRRAAIEARYPQGWQPTTVDTYLRSLTGFGDRPLIITDEITWTYADVAERAEAVARGLRKLGVVAGDRVAMVMANHPDFVTVLFGAWRLGASVIPVNFLFRADELAYVIEQSGAKVVVTMNSFRGLDYIEVFDKLEPGWREGRFERFGDLAAVVVHGAAPDGAMSVDDLLGSEPDASDPLPSIDPSPDDTAVVMYTSGTTGLPKGVTMTHDALLRTAYAAAYHRAFEDGRRILFSMPLYHAFGLLEGLLAAMVVGGSIVPQLIFDPQITLDGVARHRATELLLVPTMSVAIIEHPDAGVTDTSSLVSVLAGAAPTPVAVWQVLKDRLGVAEVFTGYGMTEHTAATTMTAPDDPLELVSSTVGRVRDAGIAGLADHGGVICEYATADPFDGTILAEGAEGEIVARGPTITAGYFAKPELNEELFIDGGWLRSGDLGRIRPDGYVELTGRSKELYKTGGELVAPAEVEASLNQHHSVSQSYVIGVPDERWGEVGCAWVVEVPGESVTEDELIDFCRSRLAKFKVPRHVLFADAANLPVTATGKVQKFKLVDRAQARIGSRQGGIT